MPSLLRPIAVFACLSVLSVSSMPGCSQQGEGEHCDNAKAGDADCDGSLRCVPRASLLDQTSDRCCPNEGTESDARCNRVGKGSSAGSSSGGSGPVGASPAGGSPGGGDANADALAGAGGGASTPSEGGMSAAGMPPSASGGVPQTSGGAGGVGGAD